MQPISTLAKRVVEMAPLNPIWQKSALAGMLGDGCLEVPEATSFLDVKSGAFQSSGDHILNQYETQSSM